MTALILENLRIALAELRANPFRSALTTLGIVIAVAAVVSVVSIVQGASRFMLEQFESLGANAIWVWRNRPPGVEGRKLGRINLTYEDAQAVRERCPAVKAVAPFIGRSAVVSFGGNEVSTQIFATTPDYQLTNNWYPDEGRFILPVEIERRANVCVIGQEVIKNLGASRDRLRNQTVLINGRPLRVVFSV